MAGNDTPQVRTCGTMAVHERLLRTDPAYMAARNRSENAHWDAVSRGGPIGRVGVTMIPVVVHVVWKTAAQNISDAQVESQIDVLNHDFRRTNPDAGNTPSVFASLVADSRVQFTLARTDPAGNPTNGIARANTASNSFSDDNKVKSAATGGADAWPRDSYLNLWVCQLGGGLLGYAQFPGGPAATDGVVILHTAFGTMGTAAAPFNLGRTATHEIGHWLNLLHIWGDDGTACNGDDFVADTPNAAGPNFGKPTFPHVTCSNGPNGDLFMNYMDYTDDDSMFMFTNGQVDRVQTSLDTDRPTLGVIIPPPTPQPPPIGSDVASVSRTLTPLEEYRAAGERPACVRHRCGRDGVLEVARPHRRRPLEPVDAGLGRRAQAGVDRGLQRSWAAGERPACVRHRCGRDGVLEVARPHRRRPLEPVDAGLGRRTQAGVDRAPQRYRAAGERPACVRHRCGRDGVLEVARPHRRRPLEPVDAGLGRRTQACDHPEVRCVPIVIIRPRGNLWKRNQTSTSL
jgi:Pregnancy-associated plasma protein-A